MKKLLLFAGLLAFAGCSKEPTPGGGGLSELKLAGKSVAVTAENNTSKATQALQQVELGVWVAEKDVEGYATAENREFESDGEGNITATVPVTLTVGKEYSVYAYAPYVASLQASGVGAIDIPHGTDALWAKEEGIMAGTGQTSVDLEFKHLGSQIEFELEGVSAATTEVQVTGFYPKGTFDLKTGEVTVTGTANQSINDAVMGTKYNFVTTGLDMALTVKVIDGADGDKEYEGTIVSPFAQGTSYLYTIKVNKSGEDPEQTVTFTPQLTDWEEVDAGNIPIE